MNVGPVPVEPQAVAGPRAALVEVARQVWIKRLMDTTRRNNLLFFRDLKTGTLDLAQANEETLTLLLEGSRVSLAKLVPTEIDGRAGTKLREIGRKAQSNLEEKGLQTLFVACGMASWPAADGGRNAEAAVLLVPLSIEAKRADAGSMYLQRAGPTQVNMALLHTLTELFGIEFAEDQFLTQLREAEGLFVAEEPLQTLRTLARNVPGFQVTKRSVIGNFSFQKLAMVKDLIERAEELESHPMVAALAGDSEARRQVASRRVSVDPRSLDNIPASVEFMVMDADSSQQAVVHAVAQDSDGVVQGPPGCGKSQTIANTIATLIAQGKRVLFVAEKRAALEAVYKRLDSVGLGHLALDLHGAAISQKLVMQKVGAALANVRHAAEPDDTALNAKFEDRRSRAVGHALRMHTSVEPSGMTPYQLQMGVLDTSRDAMSKTRWRGAELRALSRAAAEQLVDLLSEAAAHADLFSRSGSSSWEHAMLEDGARAQEALDAVTRLSRQDIPQLQTHLVDLSARSGLPIPCSISDAQTVLALIVDVNDFLGQHDERVFLRCRELVQILEPAAKGYLSLAYATITSKEFRAAKREMVQLRMGRRGQSRELLESAIRGKDLALRWAVLVTNGVPRLVEELNEITRSLANVRLDLERLTASLPLIGSMPIEQIKDLSARLASDEESAVAIPKIRSIERSVQGLGAASLLLEIRSVPIKSELWPKLFLNAWYSSHYENARAQMPELAAFNGASHSSVVAEFRQLDRQRLSIAVERVRREHAERAITAMNEFSEQADLVQAEAFKRSRHLPLRKLVAQAPDVLTAICPCWMSSPLNVSQLLPGDRQYFDAVIFDEASQVLPEDAVCAILRGRRLIVSGDRHQLPPTTFFADGANEEEEDEPTAGFESLLDQMSSFVTPWSLEWHYRSKDERLIAFSNRHIYSDSLTTFPGVGGATCVSHVLVESKHRDGEEESSSAEVDRVVALILDHAEQRPQERLGVITMGIKHAIRIQAALDRALDSRTSLEDFFDPGMEERFFIKNLEQVQGDERDAIILSVGYGKDHNGKLPYRFGPLLHQGGERRLNVAISRARRRMTVVSSFSHLDMAPGRSDKLGVELLRMYLQFASSDGTNLGEGGTSPVPLNPFEADILDALTARGIPLLPQYGVSGYRLDLAAQHPDFPGVLLLAIECDGAAYHSSPTARDRDRLRQGQLEDIGWKFHRIWSTDWFVRRQSEIERAYDAWRIAVTEYDQRSQTKDRIELLGQSSHERNSNANSGQASGRVPGSLPRFDRPAIPVRSQIDDYGDQELVDMVRWIASDGLLRTDNELIAEMTRELGFARRGPRIVEAIQWAIDKTRQKQ